VTGKAESAMRMHTFLSSLAILATIGCLTPAQVPAAYRGFAEELFFGHYPSARVAALGYLGVTLYGDQSATLYNPACVADADGLRISLGTSSRYYLLEDATYRLGALSAKLRHGLGLGVLAYDLRYGDGGDNSHIYTVALAQSTGDVIDIGLAVTEVGFDWKGHGGLKSSSVCCCLGAVGRVGLRRGKIPEHELRIGLSVWNLTNSKLEVHGSDVELPVELRLGCAYSISCVRDTIGLWIKSLEGSIMFEVLDLLNSQHNTTYAVGAEVTIAGLFRARAGYYRRHIEGGQTTRKVINQITYGIGLELPEHMVAKLHVPAGISFDYLNIPQPNRLVDARDWENYQVYTLGCHIRY